MIVFVVILVLRKILKFLKLKNLNSFLDICKNSGRWKCPNENKCFNHDMVCDSKNDCEDGADETEKVCNEACLLKGEIACIQSGNIHLKWFSFNFKTSYEISKTKQ